MGIARNSFRAIREPLFHMRYGAIRKYSTDTKVTNIAESKIQQEQFAIAQKQGEFWECVGRKPDLERGYIYHYELKDKYDEKLNPLNREALTKKFDEIFPAVEPLPYNQVLADLNYLMNSILMPQNFGYIFAQRNFQLPDKEALESRLEQLYKERPELKPLQILSSEGVADDFSFIEAYLKYDVLLSTGKEFIHDHLFHIIPRLFLMLTCPQYIYERDRLREIVSKVFYQITKAEEVIEKENLTELKRQLPKIKTAVGAMVDVIWAIGDAESLKPLNYEFFVSSFLEILDSIHYRQFAQKKFGETVITPLLINTWDQIVRLGWEGPGPAPKFCHRIT